MRLLNSRSFFSQRGLVKALACVFAAVLLFAVPLAAQEQPIKLDREKLVIEGRLDGTTTSFSRIVRVELPAGSDNTPKTLTVLRDDLQGDAGVIDRSQIQPNPQTTTLNKGQPVEITITVNNVTRPGTYTGQLSLRVQGSANEVPLPLVLDIKPRVDVKVAPTQLAATFTRCGPVPCTCPEWWPRSLCAGTWLPPYMFGNSRVLGQVDNQTPTAVNITAKELLLYGTRPGEGVNTNSLKLELPATIEPLRAEDIRLTVDEVNNIPAGRYTGTVRVSPKDATSMSTSFTLDVRDGPFWAVAVLVLGILFGRLLKNMATAEAQMQLKLFPRIRLLRNRIETIRHEGIDALLNRELTRIERRVNEATDTEQVLSQALSTLSAKADFFINLEFLATELEDPKYANIKAEALAKLKEAREKKLNGDDVGAVNAVNDVERLMAGVEPVNAASLRERRTSQISDFGDAVSAPPSMTARFFSALAGTDPDFGIAEVRFRVWRPLLFFTLLVLLTFLGLESQYLGKSNFGADGLFDYLTLFLWGISTEVINSTLQGLPARRRP
jgi:hypothetical protein